MPVVPSRAAHRAWDRSCQLLTLSQRCPSMSIGLLSYAQFNRSFSTVASIWNLFSCKHCLRRRVNRDLPLRVCLCLNLALSGLDFPCPVFRPIRPFHKDDCSCFLPFIQGTCREGIQGAGPFFAGIRRTGRSGPSSTEPRSWRWRCRMPTQTHPFTASVLSMSAIVSCTLLVRASLCQMRIVPHQVLLCCILAASHSQLHKGACCRCYHEPMVRGTWLAHG